MDTILIFVYMLYGFLYTFVYYENKLSRIFNYFEQLVYSRWCLWFCMAIYIDFFNYTTIVYLIDVFSMQCPFFFLGFSDIWTFF